MKKILSLVLVISILTTACSKHGPDDVTTSQNAVEDNPAGGGGTNTTSVPAAVLSAFNSRYTNATQVQWKQLSNGNFKAEFFRGSVKWQTTFAADGTVIKEEHD